MDRSQWIRLGVSLGLMAFAWAVENPDEMRVLRAKLDRTILARYRRAEAAMTFRRQVFNEAERVVRGFAAPDDSPIKEAAISE